MLMTQLLQSQILIVEHHPLLREHIRRSLTGEPCIEIVGEASNGSNAVEVALYLEPDVIVIDQVLPDINGLELARRIRQLMPEVRIVLLLDDQTGAYYQAALELGSTACVRKQALSTELLAAVIRE